MNCKLTYKFIPDTPGEWWEVSKVVCERRSFLHELITLAESFTEEYTRRYGVSSIKVLMFTAGNTWGKDHTNLLVQSLLKGKLHLTIEDRMTEEET